MEIEILQSPMDKLRLEIRDICVIVDKGVDLSSFEMESVACRLSEAAKQLRMVAKNHKARKSEVRESVDLAERFSQKLQICRDMLSGHSVKVVAYKHELSTTSIAKHLSDVAHYLKWTCGKGNIIDIVFFERMPGKWTNLSDSKRDALLSALELLEKDIALRREGVSVSEIMKRVWGISEASLASPDY
jgi:hypothetical protein